MKRLLLCAGAAVVAVPLYFVGVGYMEASQDASKSAELAETFRNDGATLQMMADTMHGHAARFLYTLKGFEIMEREHGLTAEQRAARRDTQERFEEAIRLYKVYLGALARRG